MDNSNQGGSYDMDESLFGMIGGRGNDSRVTFGGNDVEEFRSFRHGGTSMRRRAGGGASIH